MVITPHRLDSPIAVSATTTPLGIGGPGPAVAAPSQRSLSPALATARGITAPRRLSAEPPSALATPVGDGALAFVTRAALSDPGANTIRVQLASGQTSEAQIVGPRDHAVLVVELARSSPAHRLATSMPAGDDMVTVLASPPITIALGDIDTIEVHEGTPVLDDDGYLIGLCTKRNGDGMTQFLAVDNDVAIGHFGVATTDGR